MIKKMGLSLNHKLPRLKKNLSEFYSCQPIETNVLFSPWTIVKTYKYTLFYMLFIFYISCLERSKDIHLQVWCKPWWCKNILLVLQSWGIFQNMVWFDWPLEDLDNGGPYLIFSLGLVEKSSQKSHRNNIFNHLVGITTNSYQGKVLSSRLPTKYVRFVASNHASSRSINVTLYWYLQQASTQAQYYKSRIGTCCSIYLWSISLPS